MSQLKAILSGQKNVEKNEINRLPPDFLQCFFAISGLLKDKRRKFITKNGFKYFPKVGIILNSQHSQHISLIPISLQKVKAPGRISAKPVVLRPINSMAVRKQNRFFPSTNLLSKNFLIAWLKPARLLRGGTGPVPFSGLTRSNGYFFAASTTSI